MSTNIFLPSREEEEEEEDEDYQLADVQKKAMFAEEAKSVATFCVLLFLFIVMIAHFGYTIISLGHKKVHGEDL